ncbi:MAG: substrate-binding domain-containing protein [Actinobacteria bacterium]|nr:substrate-binding domain-containing protein [Actinomycetota bacterium]
MTTAPVTLKDVARRAGVHTGTASRALNPQTRSLVNPETATKVMRAADDLGYRPNPIARGLKTNRSFTIGVLVPDLTNPLFPPIVRGIEDTLATVGYTALLANSDNDPDKERLHFETMRSRQVDAFILATAQRDHPLIEDAIVADVPIVLVNRTVESTRAFAVITDDHRSAELAVTHLFELGHTKIAHIAGPERFSTGKARYHGFVDTMKKVGLKPDRTLIRASRAFTEREGATTFRKLLDGKGEFTAVFAGNDLIALGCYDVMTETGMRCPEDVSIVGCNDIPFLDKLRPPLTTIKIPHYEMGVRATQLVLEQLQSPSAEPVTVLLEPELVVRGSTCPPGR